MLLKSTVQLSLGWIFDNPLHFFGVGIYPGIRTLTTSDIFPRPRNCDVYLTYLL